MQVQELEIETDWDDNSTEFSNAGTFKITGPEPQRKILMNKLELTKAQLRNTTHAMLQLLVASGEIWRDFLKKIRD